MANLTINQLSLLKKHSKHHDAKHMKAMAISMRAGKTFDQAHIVAKKNKKTESKVG
tara:strand:- start:47 stop:214 length:168 start_codon:yes stop_codon:yes gene_type:complete